MIVFEALLKMADAAFKTRMQNAFFDAIRAGYAGDGTGVKKTSRGGWNTMSWESEDGFKVVDRYLIPEGNDNSAGTTTIFYGGRPVWIMNYAGHYPERAIPLLKKALSTTYGKKEFVGGRGPKELADGDMKYENQHEGDFNAFSGREAIRDKAGEVGFHRYFGMSFV